MPEESFYVNLIFKGVVFVSTLDNGRFMHKIVSINLLYSKSNITLMYRLKIHIE